MRVLVLGAGGFIGTAVTTALESAGHEVVVLRRGGTPPPGPPEPRAVFLDDLTPTSVRRLFDRLPCEAVVDAAWAGTQAIARRDPDLQAANVQRMTAWVQGAAAQDGLTWVAFGSQEEYVSPEGRVAESHPVGPVTPYAAAKIEVHRLLAAELAASARVVWLRVFGVFGPGQRPGWIVPDSIPKLLAGQRVEATVGTQRRDYVYVDDVAHAVVTALARDDARGACNVGSGTAVPVRHLLDTLHAVIGSSSRIDYGAIPQRPDETSVVEADVSRLTAWGWRPRTSLEEGLMRTVAAHRAAG